MTIIMFDDPLLFERLNRLSAAALDALDFGVIGFDPGFIVRRYSNVEAKRAGLSADTVMGMHMFEHVAQCMNNYLVAQRFHDAHELQQSLDATIDYVLTFRMRPTRVRLRLLAQPGVDMQYVVVQPAT